MIPRVGAFNINNLDDVQAVIEAAEKLNSPVILQVSEGVTRHIGVELVGSICITAAASSVHMAIHLDHCHSAKLAVKCMRYGFTSVMIDGSDLPFEKNVELTKQVVEVARLFDVSVEGELGLVGGTEDDLVVDEDCLTDPQQAIRYVELTEVDAFAPAIGTQHGLYKSKPNLDMERLRKISSCVNVPLVLHGGSGLTVDQFRECIKCGISKVNIGTDIKEAQNDAIRTYLKDNPYNSQPRPLSNAVRTQVCETVKQRIEWFKSKGKA